MNFKSFSSLWSSLIGDKSQYNIESRIFNAVSIIAIIGALVNITVNFSIGLAFYGYLLFPLVLVLLCGYYLSKYKRKLNFAVDLFAIIFNVLCSTTYFATSGSEGVNLYFFILIFFILSIVAPKRQFRIWVPITVAVLFTLLTIEYLNPEANETLYRDLNHRLLDVIQTLVEVVALITIITMIMKNNYNKEKELADQRLVELEHTNETKNKLFSIVAHDLRAPLAAVEGYLSLLREVDLSALEKADIEKKLLASTTQTSAMLTNILSWAKDQLEGITASLSCLYIKETLEHTINLKTTIAREKGIEITFSKTDDIKVIADPDMIQLIVRNLINNAIKFSMPGSTIEVKIVREDNLCVISVKDNGIGISAEKIPSIFSSTSRGTFGTNNEKGVGLGLKLTKTYTELQNGKIWFTSEVGKGSTFFVSLESCED